MANFVSVDVNRIQCLEAREVIVRTLSVQGESQDSSVALIPNNLLLAPPPLALPAPVRPHPPRGPPHLQHPQPHPRMPHPPGLQPRLLAPRPLAAPPRPEAKEHGGALPPPPGWDPARCPSPRPPLPPLHGHALEAPLPVNPRLPSPQRILPQPRGTLIPDTVAKAIAREAAQRVAAQSGKVVPPSGYSEYRHHLSRNTLEVRVLKVPVPLRASGWCHRSSSSGLGPSSQTTRTRTRTAPGEADGGDPL